MQTKEKENKITIIIPVYNTEKYLRECLSSVVCQTMADIEVVVIDDGSTDNSFAIAKEFSQNYSNFVLYHQENKGLGAARNKGLEIATGKYILFLDSDDYLAKDGLQIVYEMAEKEVLDALFYDARVQADCIISGSQRDAYNRTLLEINTEKVYKGKEFFREYYALGGVYVSACLQLLRRNFLDENAVRFKEGVFFEDNEFSLNILLKAERVKYIPQQLYIRRFRENSIMTQKYTYHHMFSAFSVCGSCVKYLLESNDTYEADVALRLFQCTLFERILDILRDMRRDGCLDRTTYVQDFIMQIGIIEDTVLSEKFSLLLAVYYRALLSGLLELCDAEVKKEYREKIDSLLQMCRKLDAAVEAGLCGIRDKYFFTQKEAKVCIYGTGKITENIIDFVLEDISYAEEKVFFTRTGTDRVCTYQKKYELLPVEKIKSYNVAAIVISSFKYAQEMKNTIKKLYGEKYKIYTYMELGDIKLTVSEKN